MCEALGVSRGGFYEWMRRPESRRSREDRALTVRIRTSFEESTRTYGSPRVLRDLRSWGFWCGRHRVERLMRLEGLQARPKRKRFPIDTGVRPEHAIAPNVLDRQFEVTAPNLSQKTYAVTVNRAAIVLSGNNNLSALGVSAGALTPAFAQGTTSYTVAAPNLPASTTVTATVADSTATLTINGSSATSGVPSASIPLAVGANSIPIVVTAQDLTTKTYTVVITRAP